MKAAIAKNECPFCAEQIMEPEKLEQLRHLEQVLSTKQFTNKEEVNRLIREKVIELLLQHFEFKRITPVEQTDDVIVLDDKEDDSDTAAEEQKENNKEESKEDKLAKAPTRNLKVVRQEARQEALKEIDPTMYQEAFNSEGVDFSNLPDTKLLQDLSDEDLKMLHGAGLDEATQQKIERLKQLRKALPKRLDSVQPRTAGKNVSITRRVS